MPAVGFRPSVHFSGSLKVLRAFGTPVQAKPTDFFQSSYIARSLKLDGKDITEAQIIQILRDPNKSDNVLIQGDAGTGKSTITAYLAHQLKKQGVVVLNLNSASSWQDVAQKLAPYLKTSPEQAEKSPKVVLVIDELVNGLMLKGFGVEPWVGLPSLGELQAQYPNLVVLSDLIRGSEEQEEIQTWLQSSQNPVHQVKIQAPATGEAVQMFKNALQYAGFSGFDEVEKAFVQLLERIGSASQSGNPEPIEDIRFIMGKLVDALQAQRSPEQSDNREIVELVPKTVFEKVFAEVEAEKANPDQSE